ncbi:protein containing DUF820 [methanotrophic bacterial endosymbiont of Bathymodiolus sp.]|jgi:Uma2 family endonuclease|nr:protein containing DUF820 [methanotrophic bacterial endosymbiont of Bathymodiolus sp.]
MALAYQEFYTLDDYLQWEGNWELIEGMPYAMAPSPSVTHQTVGLNIAANIKEQFNTKPDGCDCCSVLMETDWQVSNDTVVRPDVMVICQEINETVMVTPELIVEVVSTSSTKRDEVMKFDLFQREGVLNYILVYPEKRLAKIYQNKVSGFKKRGDYSTDLVELNIGKCRFEIDFSLVWR